MEIALEEFHLISKWLTTRSNSNSKTPTLHHSLTIIEKKAKKEKFKGS
jgi:hypothetical protein